MERTQQMARLDRWAQYILIALAVGTFALSYSGMYSVAVAAGYVWLAWLWPLVTEAAVGIFSLLYLYAKLRGYRNRWLMPLILAGTAVSVGFNVWHSPQPDLMSRGVVAVPPLLFFAAFKALVWKTEQDVKRDALTITLAELGADIERHTAALGRLTEAQAAAQTELERRKAEQHRLQTDIERLAGEHLARTQTVAALRAELERLTVERNELRAERNRLKAEPVPAQPEMEPVRARAEAIIAEHGADITGTRLAELLGDVSEGYARKLKREIVPNGSGVN